MLSTWAVRRRWVRRDVPIWPFLWRGALPLLGLILLTLYAVWPFARDDIQAAVSEQTRDALAAHDLAWVRVSVSGQDVVLSGTPPAIGAGDTAIAVSRAAACPSWLGSLTCAVSVTGRFANAAVTPGPAVPTPAPGVVACQKSLSGIVADSTIQFASGSAAILPHSEPTLDRLATEARGCPASIRIEGYTDSIGAPALNRHLSEQRAAAVMAALAMRGVPQQRLEFSGYGADRPVADNASAAGRARNRRIEFKVLTPQ
jgi:outer membrane protein OmpA-like peptidoglycan-associated protein